MICDNKTCSLIIGMVQNYMLFYPGCECHLKINLKRGSNRLSSMNRHIRILLHSATADANSSDEVTIVIVDRLAAGEDHQAVVGCLQTPKIVARARLSAVVQAVRRELAVEQDDGFSLLLRHVDAAVVGVVHVDESDEVSGRIKDGDVFKDAEICQCIRVCKCNAWRQGKCG